MTATDQDGLLDYAEQKLIVIDLGCSDTYPECPALAELHKCEDDPLQMNIDCEKSCQKCGVGFLEGQYDVVMEKVCVNANSPTIVPLLPDTEVGEEGEEFEDRFPLKIELRYVSGPKHDLILKDSEGKKYTSPRSGMLQQDTLVFSGYFDMKNYTLQYPEADTSREDDFSESQRRLLEAREHSSGEQTCVKVLKNVAISYAPEEGDLTYDTHPRLKGVNIKDLIKDLPEIIASSEVPAIHKVECEESGSADLHLITRKGISAPYDIKVINPCPQQNTPTFRS